MANSIHISIPAGWRVMRDTERSQAGDKFIGCGGLMADVSMSRHIGLPQGKNEVIFLKRADPTKKRINWNCRREPIPTEHLDPAYREDFHNT